MKKMVSTNSLLPWVILEIDVSVMRSGTPPLGDGTEVQEYGLCSQRTGSEL